MVDGYYRSSQVQKGARRTSDYNHNYVDRVRLDCNQSNNKFGGFDRGSRWRQQRSISHLDLTTGQKLSKLHKYYHRSNINRRLEYNNNLELNDYYNRIEPERDYERDYNENYDNQIEPFYQQTDIGNDACSLRRSRSLAVIREESFNDKQINSINPKRSQLIPRAKLVNRERFHHKQHNHHRREEDSTGSGVDTQTSETRESDDYYTNLKRLDSVKIFPSTWQNDKSDLESLNSDYFKNSHHQNSQKQKQQYQDVDNNKRDKNNYHLENSQSSSAFPETTTSDNSDSTTGIGSNQEEEIQETKSIEKYKNDEEEEFEEINLNNDDSIKDQQDTINSGTVIIKNSIKKDKFAVIAYDSVYLSSEDSSDDTIIDENCLHGQISTTATGNNSDIDSSLIEISINNEFENQTNTVNKLDVDKLYSQVNKPKILGVEKKLKKLSDFVQPTIGAKRDTNERLTYISSSQILKTNDIQIIDRFRPNLIENQYYSLPDINIGHSLKVSEHIDDKLRSSYNPFNVNTINDNYDQLINDEDQEDVIDLSFESDYYDEQLEDIYDSITHFGRTHKKVRQREYCGDINLVIKSNISPIDGDSDETEGVENPKEIPSIEIKIDCKEYNTNTLSDKQSDQENQEDLKSESDFQINQKITNFPGQFRIFVTDTQNNIIEEDSIESLLCTNQDDDEKKENLNEIDSLSNIQNHQENIKKLNLPTTKISLFENQNNSHSKNRVIEKAPEITIEEYSTKVIKQYDKPSSNHLNHNHLNQVEDDEKSLVNPKQIDTTDIFKAHPVSIYSNDVVKVKKNKVNNNQGKMSRPQILHVIDSKRCQDVAKNHSTNVTSGSASASGGGGDEEKNYDKIKTEKEFLEKVDSVRCYWSKLIQDEIDSTSQVQHDENNERNYVTSLEDDSIEPQQPNVQKILTKSKSINLLTDTKTGLQSFCPTIEIVELNGQKQAAIVKASNNNDEPDFDHVRYKVMKSNLFRKNILARNKKEAQFDGLIQYLQDYSFQELLTNNNVVIIEPVRTKIEQPSDDGNHGTTSKLHTVNCKITGGSGTSDAKTKRHFFYHPVRVNRELLEEELPNPDTVRNVRRFFEQNFLGKQNSGNKSSKGRMKSGMDSSVESGNCDTTYGNGLRKWDSVSLSSGISSGDLSSPCECNEGETQHDSPDSQPHHHHHHHHRKKDDLNSNRRTEIDEEEVYSSQENLCDDEMCASYYVSEDILEKIRECGSTVTYYGGRVLNNKSPELSPMTKSIIEEIRGKKIKCNACQPKNCPNDDDVKEKFNTNDNNSLGVKFKLVKSNSCSSRLELAGTEGGPTSISPSGSKLLVQQNRSPSPLKEPEETVRELVNRLESGTVNNSSVPRIIESKCIEKSLRNNSSDNNKLKLNEDDPSMSINNHLIATKVDNEHMGLVDINEHVTVNNHINLIQPNGKVQLKIINENGNNGTSLCDDGHTSFSSMSVEKIILKSNNNKVCRNRNVDLAFNMSKSGPLVGGCVSSENNNNNTNINKNEKLLTVSHDNNKNTDKRNSNGVEILSSYLDEKTGMMSTELLTVSTTMKSDMGVSNSTGTNMLPVNSSISSFSSRRDMLNGNSNINVNNIGNVNHKMYPNSNKIEHHTISDIGDSRKPTTIFQITNSKNGSTKSNDIVENQPYSRENDEWKKQQSSVLEKNTTNLWRSNKTDAVSKIQQNTIISQPAVTIIPSGKLFEKHYVANDKKLIEKRKYDEIEFEEFEVYDPNTAATISSTDSTESPAAVQSSSLSSCKNVLPTTNSTPIKTISNDGDTVHNELVVDADGGDKSVECYDSLNERL